MFLTTPNALRARALFRHHVSKTVSVVVLISTLTVSIPAAPSVVADAASSISRIDFAAPRVPAFDALSLPAIDAAPLAAIYHNSTALSDGSRQS